MISRKYFFNKYKNYFKKSILYKNTNRSKFAGNKDFHSLMSFYIREEKKFYDRSMRYSNIMFTRRFRRKIFIYIQPFFVNRIFFSKLFGAKLIKRLANIW